MAHVNPIQVQKFLKGVDYPANKDALLARARELGADDNVCSTLEQLPDEEFQTPTDVSQAFGQIEDDGPRSDSPQQSSSDAQDFLSKATCEFLAEVELCEIALEKASDDEVKAFAQRMIDEHSRIGEQIEHIAQKKNVPLPDDLPSEYASTIRSLSSLSGDDFEKRFIDYNVDAHEKEVEMFRQCAQQEDDDDIRMLAEKGAQMLDHHLKMARDLRTRLQGR